MNAAPSRAADAVAGLGPDASAADTRPSVEVLFLCTHNSARSILAEAMLNHWARRLGRPVRAHSAGSAPGTAVQPLALAVLAAAGVDTAGLRSKSWDGFATAGAPPLDIVVTVCDDAAAESCPYFVGRAGRRPVRLHWGVPDRSRAEGDATQRRRAFELTRQALGYRVLQLLALPLQDLSATDLQSALRSIAGN
ncbi:MAG: arsenate reductase ArsC [Gammaproteobacteria bacterium]